MDPREDNAYTRTRKEVLLHLLFSIAFRWQVRTEKALANASANQ